MGKDTSGASEEMATSAGGNAAGKDEAAQAAEAAEAVQSLEADEVAQRLYDLRVASQATTLRRCAPFCRPLHGQHLLPPLLVLTGTRKNRPPALVPLPPMTWFWMTMTICSLRYGSLRPGSKSSQCDCPRPCCQSYGYQTV